jgi:hypothetical protein
MARSILARELPRFVPPMLAQPGVPFDSSEHVFEVKWDGTRVLAFVESYGYRLVNRHRADVSDRYPELGFLNDFPAGIILDGEVVVLRQGKPDFGLLLSRNQARAQLSWRPSSKAWPGSRGPTRPGRKPARPPAGWSARTLRLSGFGLTPWESVARTGASKSLPPLRGKTSPAASRSQAPAEGFCLTNN